LNLESAASNHINQPKVGDAMKIIKFKKLLNSKDYKLVSFGMGHSKLTGLEEFHI
jgi:succinate dehydrogenase flavin-adding protein (antitoxin of CptAB toxin-antitoxin module)